MTIDLQISKTYTRFNRKKLLPGGGHFESWKFNQGISMLLGNFWTSKTLERSNNYFSSYRVSKNFFASLILGKTNFLKNWLFVWIMNSICSPCWCSSKKTACGGGAGGKQHNFGPNGPRGKNEFSNFQNICNDSTLRGIIGTPILHT